MEIEFKVLGSSPEPYVVRFVRRGDNDILAFCTCPAGEKGQHCKHRIGILNGSTESILSGNMNQVDEVLSWVKGTDLENAIERIKSLEESEAKIKVDLAATKKKIAKIMQGKK